MFKEGELVRKVDSIELGIIKTSFSSIGPRRYKVLWENGEITACKPTDIRCITRQEIVEAQ
jgi:hypothetical protein